MMVTPLLAGNVAGPKSGAHSGRAIFAANPSYSPSRIASISRRTGLRADSAKR
jgi:hypothetical protein